MTRYETYIRKEHNAWQDKVHLHLPELASRVFALRGRHYMGCGFHYSLEKSLGYVIREINDHTTPFDFGCAVVLKVIVTGLFQDIVRAEKSADELELKYGSRQ